MSAASGGEKGAGGQARGGQREQTATIDMK
jgi:hypothetical protein